MLTYFSKKFTLRRDMFMRDQKLKFLVVDALFAVIIALLAQVAIPLGPIPLTGQTFAIGLAATILGARHGTISVLVYIVLGAVGIPVFQGMTAGIGILLGQLADLLSDLFLMHYLQVGCSKKQNSLFLMQSLLIF